MHCFENHFTGVSFESVYFYTVTLKHVKEDSSNIPHGCWIMSVHDYPTHKWILQLPKNNILRSVPPNCSCGYTTFRTFLLVSRLSAMIHNRGDICTASRIVIKAGTSVVSTPDGYPSLSRIANIVENAARLLKEGKQVMIVTSGLFHNCRSLYFCICLASQFYRCRRCG